MDFKNNTSNNRFMEHPREKESIRLRRGSKEYVLKELKEIVVELSKSSKNSSSRQKTKKDR